jgi:hypothetical protein
MEWNMRKITVPWIAAALCGLSVLQTWAQGTAGFEILRLQVYPRGSALGGSLVSDDGHIESLYYNPAGLAGLRQQTAAAGYMNYLLDINSGYLAFARPEKQWGNWGMHLLYTNYGDFDRRDKYGVDQGKFYASDFVIGFSWAKAFENSLQVGGSGKFVHSKIADYTASALALDLGVQYQLMPDRLKVGAGLFNLGRTTNVYIHSDDDLPLCYRIGISGTPEGFPATLYFAMTIYQENADNYSLSNLDGSDILDFFGDAYYGFGAEFNPMETLFLRIGYDTRGLDQQVGTRNDPFAGLSGGVGLDLTLARLDIGLSSYGELGLVMRAGLSSSF